MTSNISEQDLIDIAPLDSENRALTADIVKETNIDKLKVLVDEFNLTQTKKNALRILNYNTLLDKISNQMVERITKCPDEFTNADLLQYLQAIQSTMDKSTKSLNAITETSPAIIVNQINVNENKEFLDVESRQKIDLALNAILNTLNTSGEKIVDIEESSITAFAGEDEEDTQT